MLFHMILDSVKGLIAYVVLNAAGILSGRFFINTEIYKELGQHGVALVDTFSKDLSGLGKSDMTVGIFFNQAFILKKTQGAADRGF